MSAPEKELAEQFRYYILAPPDSPPESGMVLKRNDAFGLWNRFGDIDTESGKHDGVFYKGTRFLSLNRLRLQGQRPLLLSSTVRRDNVVLTVDLTNPDIHWEHGPLVVARGSLHLHRRQFFWEDTLYQHVHIKNFSRETIDIDLTFQFEADFVDIFEVRGHPRSQRGRNFMPRRVGDAVILGYEGLDSVQRTTLVRSATDPDSLGLSDLHVKAKMEPGSARTIEISFSFAVENNEPAVGPYRSSAAKATNAARTAYLKSAIETSNEQFDVWIDRSRADLNMLVSETPDGAYPQAGVPWFAAPFGRDGIITALECLWLAPDIARGVLGFLTKTQATERSPAQDAEPGKILHEAREGEMAALGEIPFGRYYGSVDSTPLYLMLAAAYFRRTHDAEFLRSIWNNIEAALNWIDTDGDPDHDGFVDYARQSPNGLVQQGWKDSNDSIFHADGSLAEGPVALCEVQGYVYAAKMGLAEVAAALGKDDRARDLFEQSRRLQDRFEKFFWSAELGTYALALDGAKNQCAVRSSNPGHLLYCRIVSQERARLLAAGILGSDFHSGWGIRTIAEGEVRYNPMSYHNGSIWPHDNAIIAAGLGRYGQTHLASRILTGIFEAAASFELSRLPELFCGFGRRIGESPVNYPTACAPQAWSSGAVFLLLQASLGLSVNAMERKIVLRRPVLPRFLRQLHIRDIEIHSSRVDLHLFRSGKGVAAMVERRTGDVEVVVLH